MKKFLALTALLFKEQYKNKPTVGGKNRRVGTIIAYVVLALCFAPIFVVIAINMYLVGGMIGVGNSYSAGVVAFLILLCQGFVFMFGLPSIISNLYTVKDAQKLLYLPIKSTTIFLAKFMVVYLNEVLTTILTVLCILLPFGIGAGATFAYYLMLIPSLLLIPLFPMLVGAIVCLPISWLINVIAKSGVSKTILQTAFFVTFMVVYMIIFSSIGTTSGPQDEFVDMEQIQNVVVPIFVDMATKMTNVLLHPVYMLATAVLSVSIGSWALGLIATIAENALIFAVLVTMSLPIYKGLLTSSLEDTSSRSQKLTDKDYDTPKGGVVQSLVVTDFKRTIRNPQLGFQAFSGLILMPLIIVMLYFSLIIDAEGGQAALNVLAAEPLYNVVAPIFIIAYLCLIGIGTNVTGLYPISRENNSFYLTKSLPIPFSKILLSKVILSTVIMLVCDFITIVLCVALLKIGVVEGVLMLITLALVGFGSMCITTLLDLKSPKLGWTSFQQSLKNSKNSWIAMLIGLLSALVLGAVCGLFVWLYLLTSKVIMLVLMWIALVFLASSYAYLGYKLMVSKAEYYFNRIEV